MTSDRFGMAVLPAVVLAAAAPVAAVQSAVGTAEMAMMDLAIAAVQAAAVRAAMMALRLVFNPRRPACRAGWCACSVAHSVRPG